MISRKSNKNKSVKETADMAKLSQSNNNDEDFLNINPTPESGRDSRNSAFSSEGEDTSGPLSSAGSSSGRSSTNLQEGAVAESWDESITVLKTRSNLIEEGTEVTKLVEAVRVEFLNWYRHQDASSLNFDPKDVAELEKPLPDSCQFQKSVAFRWISRYINFQLLLDEPRKSSKAQKEIDSAVNSLKEFLKFRNNYQLSHTVPEDFAREFYILSGIFSFGLDKQGIPILYLRARVHRRWSSRLDDSFRRYVAWSLDQLTKSNPGSVASKTAGKSRQAKDGSFVICFDCLSVSYACLDMDFLRYLVRILVDYYPTYCRYALVVDLPWLFRSVWKLVKTWLPEESQDTVHMITSKQLVDFIDSNQIPNSQKINDLKAHEKPAKCKHQLPSNFSSIANLEDRAKELEIGHNELKSLKLHIDKVQKEYEQLGAL